MSSAVWCMSALFFVYIDLPENSFDFCSQPEFYKPKKRHTRSSTIGRRSAMVVIVCCVFVCVE